MIGVMKGRGKKERGGRKGEEGESRKQCFGSGSGSGSGSGRSGTFLEQLEAEAEALLKD